MIEDQPKPPSATSLGLIEKQHDLGLISHSDDQEMEEDLDGRSRFGRPGSGVQTRAMARQMTSPGN